MNTFQSVIYGIVHSFTQFLPLSASAHHSVVAYLLQWPAPSQAFTGTLALGSFLALLLYFRHDWLSMFAGILQVIVYRKKPMTVDERMPFFILAACMPIALAWYYLGEPTRAFEWTPVWLAALLAAFGIVLGGLDGFSRRSKSMVDWNWWDAIVAGLGACLVLLPGAGLVTGILCASLFRNYNREAAAKFAYFVAFPVVGAQAYLELRGLDFHSAMPDHDLSWLSLITALLVTTIASLLVIGGFIKSTQRKGYGHLIAYRVVVALAVGVVFWVRSRG